VRHTASRAQSRFVVIDRSLSPWIAASRRTISWTPARKKGFAAGQPDMTDTETDKKPRQVFKFIGVQIFLIGKERLPLLRPTVKTIKGTAVRQGNP
jgi:hypothetical protein